MTNIYQQIVDMELHDLEDKMIDLQNVLVSNYSVLEELWTYHPSNPDFINPIKAYDELKKQIFEIEKELIDVENKIKHLRSAN
jgi:predicted  nucleic acid-binding Zn-ribbon protein